MSSFHLASFRPQIEVRTSGQLSRMSYVSPRSRIATAHIQTSSRTCLITTISRPNYRRCPPACVFRDGGKSDGGQEPLDIPPGDVGRKLSLEEILRQQIEKQEGEGGPPDGGGRGRGRRGRGGGGGGESGGSGEETPAEQLHELLCVILTTVGVILLYVYMLEGPEITVLAKDYLRFLVTGNRSFRLKRAMYEWRRFWQTLTTKKKAVRAEDRMALLQRELLKTPTCYDSPAKYRHIVRAYMASKLADIE